VDLLQLQPDSLLNNASTALAAVAFMTVWTSLGFNFIIGLWRFLLLLRWLTQKTLQDG
jgi:ABC-type sugar transport system permease subunit